MSRRPSRPPDYESESRALPELAIVLMVTLPALDQAPHETAASRDPLSSQAASAQRVLVVDDNIDSALMLAELLRMDGHTVMTTHNGTEAIRLCGEFLPDFVFLDIGLPGMTGYEVAQEIRKLPACKHVFLAALTGWGQESDHRRSAESGFNVHLLKPVDPDAVSALILRAAHRANR